MHDEYVTTNIAVGDEVYPIWQRRSDNYIDMPAFCKQFGKQFGCFFLEPGAQEMVDWAQNHGKQLEGSDFELFKIASTGHPGGVTVYMHPGIMPNVLMWLTGPCTLFGKSWMLAVVPGDVAIGLDDILRDTNEPQDDDMWL